MIFAVPTSEQRFLLKHVARVDELAALGFPGELSAEIVDAIVGGAAAFAEKEYAPLNRLGDTCGARLIDGTVKLPDGHREAYMAFVQNGWGSVAGAIEYGGQGLPFTLATVVLEDLGAANIGFSLCPMLTPGAIEVLEEHGSEEQKATWLPKLISGEWPGTMNLTEPHAGTDVGALRAMAAPTEGGLYKIRGQKIFITYGEHDLSDNIVHLVLARTPDAPPGIKGVSLFLVPKKRLDGEGNPTVDNDVRCVSIEHKLGIHVSPTCIMSYGEEGGCLGELIGSVNGGIRAMFTMMNNARINVGNQGIQVAERARQQAVGYAMERIQSPRASGSSGVDPVAIIEHPDVRRMIMRTNALTQGARALLYYATGQADRAKYSDAAARARLNLLTPLVKSYGSDVGCEVASLGVQIHGGMGFIEETGAAQHYRDARIMPIYEGTNGVQAADLVSRKLMGDGGAALRALLEEIRIDAEEEPRLLALLRDIEEVTEWMLDVSVDDRLSGSYPFMTMLSVLTSGWLMLRQSRIAQSLLSAPDAHNAFLANKIATASFHLGCLVPEASGLKASAMAGSNLLYSLSTEEVTAW